MFARPDHDFAASAAPIGVSELLGQARQALERSFPLQWISGEIATLTRAASGHCYFTLRDANAQVRCVMYRTRAQLLPFRLSEGQKVEVRALVTLYEARGEFQLQVENLRQAGRGTLFEEFLRLKERLTAEGLFDAARKRELPRLPRGIGLITSLQAAALHDVLSTLKRRAPQLAVVIYPSPVQGDAAPARLCAALQEACARAPADGIELLLMCRGGGSMEDLWAFNDEALVRAIASATLPVVSGIGHETDFTLADFAADLRAATPTAAAELVSAGHVVARERCLQLEHALATALQRRLAHAWQRCDRVRLGLRHPRQGLALQRTQLQGLRQTLVLRMAAQQRRAKHQLALQSSQLRARRPSLEAWRLRLQEHAKRLPKHWQGRVTQQGQQLAALSARLAQLAPAAVLARGYAIVRHADGRLLVDSGAVAAGERLEIQAAKGRLHALAETPPTTGSKPAPTNG